MGNVWEVRDVSGRKRGVESIAEGVLSVSGLSAEYVVIIGEEKHEQVWKSWSDDLLS